MSQEKAEQFKELEVGSNPETLRVLATILKEAQRKSFCLQRDIVEKSGLDEETATKQLKDLFDNGIIRTTYCQIGTAGPYEHRIHIVDRDAKVTIWITINVTQTPTVRQ